MKKRLLFAVFALSVCSGVVWSADEDTVAIYPVITGGADVAVEGRVIERKTAPAMAVDDGRVENLRRSLELMINNERKSYPVTVRFGEREWRTKTDSEGYFRVELTELAALTAGWHTITAQTERGVGVSTLLKVAPENMSGLISDIDDTIQVTEVNDKSRMLANTFLRNAMQRTAVPGIAEFYRTIVQSNPYPDSAPIVYLSASPKQLHTVIEGFLSHNSFPRGVLTTKRVTDDSTSDPLTDQVTYKTKKLEAILAMLPNVRFTLVGDDGEYDPEIYADIQKRFPDRVAAIWIRAVNPDPQRVRIDGQGDLNAHLESLAPK